MKNLLVALSLLVSTSAFAASGFEQLTVMFDLGSEIDVSTLRMIDEGIYTGRCFTTESAIPSGAFLTFRDDAVDTGPIQVDPDLKLIWGNQADAKFYDTADVKQLVTSLKLLPAPLSEDGLSREVEYLHWTVQFRLAGSYIVQRNLAYGEATSYCYYFQFRNL